MNSQTYINIYIYIITRTFSNSTIFRKFATIFRRFPKILQKMSKGSMDLSDLSENGRKLPKMSKDNRRLIINKGEENENSPMIQPVEGCTSPFRSYTNKFKLSLNRGNLTRVHLLLFSDMM